MNETEQVQCRQTMRLIMIYSENVALARQKLELILFCRDSMMMMMMMNERLMMISVLQTYWEKMKWSWSWSGLRVACFRGGGLGGHPLAKIGQARKPQPRPMWEDEKKWAPF